MPPVSANFLAVVGVALSVGAVSPSFFFKSSILSFTASPAFWPSSFTFLPSTSTVTFSSLFTANLNHPCQMPMPMSNTTSTPMKAKKFFTVGSSCPPLRAGLSMRRCMPDGVRRVQSECLGRSCRIIQE